jgi:hypothetical protein
MRYSGDVTRARRIVSALFTTLSAFVFLAVTTLWVCSYSKSREIDITVRRELYILCADRGGLTLSGPPVAPESEIVEAWRRVSLLRNSDLRWYLLRAPTPPVTFTPQPVFTAGLWSSHTPAEERALLRALDDPNAFVAAYVVLTIGRGVSTIGRFEYARDGAMLYDWAGLRLRCSADTWAVLNWRILMQQFQQIEKSGAVINAGVWVVTGDPLRDSTWDADPAQRHSLRALWARRLCTARFRVPYWALLLPVVVAPARRGLSRWRIVRRMKACRCPTCAYDLRTTPGRCPECGWGMGVGGAEPTAQEARPPGARG